MWFTVETTIEIDREDVPAMIKEVDESSFIRAFYLYLNMANKKFGYRVSGTALSPAQSESLIQFCIRWNKPA